MQVPRRPLRLAIVTNIPAPYRVPVYNRLAQEPGMELCAFYSARTEADRQWDLPAFAHAHQFPAGRVHERRGRYIHYNPAVWSALGKFRPDVVLTTGFNPTHLLAWLFALLHCRAHVVMTDGTDSSEQHLGVLHQAARRLVFSTSKAFVVASEGGRRLLHAYGIRDSRIHASPLCANPAVDWVATTNAARDVDLLFSGRLVAIKNADFALHVAQGVAKRMGRRVRLVLLGSGPRECALRELATAKTPDVDVQFAGHVAQSALPAWFQRAKLFLFPTQWDPWGVVANEACLAGVPVLVSPHAGAANDLVRDGVNGRVLELDLDVWVCAAADLLMNDAARADMATAAQAIVRNYDAETAATGIADAARQAVAPRGSAVPRPGPYQR